MIQIRTEIQRNTLQSGGDPLDLSSEPERVGAAEVRRDVHRRSIEKMLLCTADDNSAGGVESRTHLNLHLWSLVGSRVGKKALPQQVG